MTDVVWVYVCVFVLHPLLFHFSWDSIGALSPVWEIDHCEFADWMLFLSSNRKEEISFFPEALSDNT